MRLSGKPPVLAALLWVSATAWGVGIINPDFGDGLNGWTTVGQVTNGGGYALLGEQPPMLLASLGQSFVMPSGICALTFQVDMTTVPTGPLVQPWDAFMASLLDATTLQPVVRTNSSVTDFYYRDASGYVDYSAALVTVSGDVVRLDLTSQMGNLAGRQLTLAFDLLGFNDGRSTHVALDDIRLVPEPGTLTLLALGALGLLRRRFRRPSAR